MKNEFLELDHLEIRDLYENEVDFTRHYEDWMKQLLYGIGLFNITSIHTELSLGVGSRCDILGDLVQNLRDGEKVTTHEGVLIEVQLGKMDDSHFSKILRYVSSLDSIRVAVWIAEKPHLELINAVKRQNEIDKKVSYFVAIPRITRLGDSNALVFDFPVRVEKLKAPYYYHDKNDITSSDSYVNTHREIEKWVPYLFAVYSKIISETDILKELGIKATDLRIVDGHTLIVPVSKNTNVNRMRLQIVGTDSSNLLVEFFVNSTGSGENERKDRNEKVIKYLRGTEEIKNMIRPNLKQNGKYGTLGYSLNTEGVINTVEETVNLLEKLLTASVKNLYYLTRLSDGVEIIS